MKELNRKYKIAYIIVNSKAYDKFNMKSSLFHNSMVRYLYQDTMDDAHMYAIQIESQIGNEIQCLGDN